MAPVIHTGLSALPDADIRAQAVYFADVDHAASRMDVADAAVKKALAASHLGSGQEYDPDADLYAAACIACHYNAGPVPYDGELLDRTGYGNGHLRLENRAVQPAVVKLRNRVGAVVLSVFLAPGGHADVEEVPDGSYRTEFAVGELWSRACKTFAAGMRARRLDQAFTIAGEASLEITADAASLPSTDIADQVFELN